MSLYRKDMPMKPFVTCSHRPLFLCTRALEKLVLQSLSSGTEVEVLVPKDQGLLYSVSFVNLVYLYMAEEIMSCNTN